MFPQQIIKQQTQDKYMRAPSDSVIPLCLHWCDWTRPAKRAICRYAAIVDNRKLYMRGVWKMHSAGWGWLGASAWQRPSMSLNCRGPQLWINMVITDTSLYLYTKVVSVI